MMPKKWRNNWEACETEEAIEETFAVEVAEKCEVCESQEEIAEENALDGKNGIFSAIFSDQAKLVGIIKKSTLGKKLNKSSEDYKKFSI